MSGFYYVVYIYKTDYNLSYGNCYIKTAPFGRFSPMKIAKIIEKEQAKSEVIILSYKEIQEEIYYEGDKNEEIKK